MKKRGKNMKSRVEKTAVARGGAKKSDSETESIKRALTARTGEVLTINTGHTSITIGRTSPLPIQDDEPDDFDYPDVPKGKSDYDTWLG